MIRPDPSAIGLSFMGVEPVETFRCRVYWSPPTAAELCYQALSEACHSGLRESPADDAVIAELVAGGYLEREPRMEPAEGGGHYRVWYPTEAGVAAKESP